MTDLHEGRDIPDVLDAKLGAFLNVNSYLLHQKLYMFVRNGSKEQMAELRTGRALTFTLAK